MTKRGEVNRFLTTLGFRIASDVESSGEANGIVQYDPRNGVKVKLPEPEAAVYIGHVRVWRNRPHMALAVFGETRVKKHPKLRHLQENNHLSRRIVSESGEVVIDPKELKGSPPIATVVAPLGVLLIPMTEKPQSRK